jgi:hypothetical protein
MSPTTRAPDAPQKGLIEHAAADLFLPELVKMAREGVPGRAEAQPPRAYRAIDLRSVAVCSIFVLCAPYRSGVSGKFRLARNTVRAMTRTRPFKMFTGHVPGSAPCCAAQGWLACCAGYNRMRSWSRKNRDSTREDQGRGQKNSFDINARNLRLWNSSLALLRP